jgi:hypothetical protein
MALELGLWDVLGITVVKVTTVHLHLLVDQFVSVKLYHVSKLLSTHLALVEAVVVSSFTEDVILFYVWGHLNVFPVHTDVNIEFGVVDVAGVGVVEGGRLIDTIDLAEATWDLVNKALILVLAVVLNRFVGVEAMVSTITWGGIGDWSVLITAAVFLLRILFRQNDRYADDQLLVGGGDKLVACGVSLFIRFIFVEYSFMYIFFN